MGLLDRARSAVRRLDTYLGPSYGGGDATSPVRPAGNAVGEGWVNALTGMGYAATDPSQATTIAPSPLLTAQQACDLYDGDGMAARVVDLPAQEALRQGWSVKWEGDEGDAERVQQWADRLSVGPEGQRGLNVALEQWLRWRAQYGGAVVVLICADGRDTSEPLDESRPNLRALRVLSRYDLTPVGLERDPITGQTRQGSDLWQVQGAGITYHRSRLIFAGRAQLPSTVADRRQGWQASDYERLWTRLRACGTVDAAAAQVVHGFVTPVQRMKGLAEALASGGDAILRRMGFEQLTRSQYRVTLLDADNETFENQTTSVAGLPELMDRFPERVSAATGIPMTLLMGHAPSGLSTDDQSGRRFFYDSIKARLQMGLLLPALTRILTLAMRSPLGPTGGVEPIGWVVEFAPLYQLTELEQEDVALKRAQRDQVYIAAGVLSPDEVRQSRFAGVEGDVTIQTPTIAAPAL